MRIGCHVSIRHGFYAAAKSALVFGCGAFQYFPKNPRSLTVKSFDKADATKCKEFCIAHHLQSISHTPYPVNLATEHSELRKATMMSLLNDLTIADACGSIGVVVHYGKYSGDDPLQGYRNVIQLLNDVLQEWRGNAMILIENQAAGMGTTIEELVQIRALVEQPEYIGFCLDTCHAFAGGLWNGANWEQVERIGKELDYWAHLKTIHLNDSKYPYGSNKDFHANIGRGFIGEMYFREFLHSPYISHLPIILETPTLSSFPISQEIRYVIELANS
ncbi:MAG: deoxyribonuclease IV [Paenibacillaceae bacterium]